MSAKKEDIQFDIIERLYAVPETGADPELIEAAAAEIERLRTICAKAKEALYAGTLDDFEVAEMLESATQ